MITDRDICMAVAMRDTNPSSVSVEEVMTGQVFSVNSEDELDQALEAMNEHKIRRLPVVNAEGELEGILSLNDVVLHATTSEDGADVGFDEVVKTYQSICQHPLSVEVSAAATV